MAINKKLIHYKTFNQFKSDLDNGNILEHSICYIKDRQLIYTHNQYYKCNDKLDSFEPASGTTVEELTPLATDTISEAIGKVYSLALMNEGGGTVDLREKVKITLTSNQTQPDNSLIGASVVVTDITQNTVIADTQWNRQEITAMVPPQSDYTIQVGNVEGYATPETLQFNSAIQGERNVNIVYNACMLTVVTEGLDEIKENGVSVSYDSVTKIINSGDSIKVPYGKSVTVSCVNVDGYSKPENVTFVPSTPNHTVTLTYIKSTLTVIIDSNQTDKTDMAGANATVTFNGTDHVVESNQSVAIPIGTEITVSFGDVNGYKKPDNIVFTSAGGAVEKTGIYKSEFVSVTLSSDNSAVMTGQKVTINGTEYTYQGTPILAKVPFGTHYTISVDAKNQYTTPQPQLITASQAHRSVAMVYTYNSIKYNTIILNQALTDPAAMLSGDINGEIVQLIRQNSHRVLAKKTAEGEVTYCRLKDDDGTKYYDGTSAALSGGEGDVFTKLPQFFWKVTTDSAISDFFHIELAYGGNPGEGWHEWDGNVLIGTYKAYGYRTKLYSRSGVDPLANITQPDFKNYARNRGTGYTLVDWEMHCVLAMLYYCQYGHMNCQLKIGAGTTVMGKTTGFTNTLGMTDTVAGRNGDNGSINFWGLENWWGDIYEWIDNIEFNNRIGTIVATIINPDGSTRKVHSHEIGNAYPKKMIINEYFDLIAELGGASSDTGYCDQFVLSGISGTVLAIRSGARAYASCGVSNLYISYDASYYISEIGSRLAFRGTCIEAESVKAFKALPIIN